MKKDKKISPIKKLSAIEKNDIRQRSRKRVEEELEKIRKNNLPNYLCNKLKFIAASFCRNRGIPNINKTAEVITQTTYQKLLSGKRLWDEDACPKLEKQFILSLISEQRNFYRKHCLNNKYYISGSDTSEMFEDFPSQTLTPEQYQYNEDIDRKMSLFLNFLKEHDLDAHAIQAYSYFHDIDISKTRILAKELGLPIKIITNSKRRLIKLRKIFQLQIKGDLL